MIHIKQAIVVEGKYDKIKLSSIVDAVILVTNGFQIYKNPEQLDLIRYYARTTGVILMTDADRAGFQIRNYLKGAIQQGTVYQVYTPDVYGKEHRKEKPSAEGKLGVEGISSEIYDKKSRPRDLRRTASCIRACTASIRNYCCRTCFPDSCYRHSAICGS